VTDTWTPYPDVPYLRRIVPVAHALLKLDPVQEIVLGEVRDPYGVDEVPYIILVVVDEGTADAHMRLCCDPPTVDDVDFADIESDTSVAFETSRPVTQQELVASALGLHNMGLDTEGMQFVLIPSDWRAVAADLDAAWLIEDWRFSDNPIQYAANHFMIFNPSKHVFSEVG
jgi:hypothetical protein